MFVKLYPTLFEGSMRGQTDMILVWVNILCHCDQNGVDDRHWRVIADETGLPLDRVKQACIELEAPDNESRTPNEEGRRLRRLDDHRGWGWQVINYQKYRDMRTAEDRREYKREWMRQNRLEQKSTSSPQLSITVHNCPQESTGGQCGPMQKQIEIEIQNTPLPPKGESSPCPPSPTVQEDIPRKRRNTRTETEPAPGGLLQKAYVSRYEVEYGFKPQGNKGQWIALTKKGPSDMTSGQAAVIVDAFFADAYATKQKHPLALLVSQFDSYRAISKPKPGACDPYRVSPEMLEKEKRFQDEFMRKLEEDNRREAEETRKTGSEVSTFKRS